MATESASATSPTTASPLTGPSSLGSGLITKSPDGNVYRTTHGHGIDRFVEPRAHSIRRQSRDSRRGSLDSSGGRSFEDKRLESFDPRYGYTAHASGGHPLNGYPGGRDTARMDGRRRDQEGPNRLSKSASSKKDKRGGFRNTLRRVFGRTPKTRISMPTPTVQPRHDPREFITSVVDLDAKPPRAASVPAVPLPRTSALSSHPPFRHTAVEPVQSVETDVAPPQPERRAPERPPRPRRASVPSVLLNREDVQAMEAALSDPDLQEKQELNLEARNIGFAVTNGSNPKRRSRSAGACPSADHRMSPIQWHHIRRRSDEIRYWRESTPLDMFDTKFDQERDADSPDLVKEENETTGEETSEQPGGEKVTEQETQEGPDEGFHFGLPSEAVDIQAQERVGLEERVVTLEIKLMDFEYALSKIQADENPPISPRLPHRPLRRRNSMGSFHPEIPQPRPGDSPVMTNRFVDEKDYAEPHAAADISARPTSIATTLKPSVNEGSYASGVKPPTGMRSTRASITSLTIDHVSTLINLLRHEQSARQRLEEQVTLLQAQMDRLVSSTPYASRSPYAGSVSQHSHSYSQSSQLQQQQQQQRRHGMVVSPASDSRRRGGPAYLPQQTSPSHKRTRSSSYGTDTTTDDDEAYHDAYVTPALTPMEFPRERGEFERGAFERIGVEEGVAF